jgi:hypothetical protein
MSVERATQKTPSRAAEQRSLVGLEQELNEILSKACEELMGSPARVEHFAGLFDRSHETGFYANTDRIRGQGEQPTWSPNPAYIDSLEEMWTEAAARLDQRGLALEKGLRDLFFTSHEYHDRENDHRRVFHGHLVDKVTGIPRTFFMLTVPHSHDGFRYVDAPAIRLSAELS